MFLEYFCISHSHNYCNYLCIKGLRLIVVRCNKVVRYCNFWHKLQ